jgi:drug/metabolite transporter (DMT)-like permease
MLWAGNALTGRLLADTVPPLMLNALRWWLAGLLLLPLGWRVFAAAPRRAELRQRWPALLVLGGLGIGAYNALQYQALQTSTPLNVTLIASSTPMWMMLIGRLFYREHPTARQGLAALLSLAGVLTVLARGEWQRLAQIELVGGDLWMLLAAISWAFYSWQLARPPAALRGVQRPHWTWAEFLLVQVLFGLLWATTAAGAEAVLAPRPAVPWSLGLVAALLFLAVGPSVLAYRCWGLGVAAAGPAVAGFFANLTPLFAALLSAWWLGQWPQAFHGLAFALIVGGIVVSSRR